MIDIKVIAAFDKIGTVVAVFWLTMVIARGSVAVKVKDKGVRIIQLKEKEAMMDRSSQNTMSKVAARLAEDTTGNDCKAIGV